MGGELQKWNGNDDKKLPAESGSWPVPAMVALQKRLSSALFFGLCGVNAGGLSGSTLGYGQKRPSKVDSLLHA